MTWLNTTPLRRMAAGGLWLALSASMIASEAAPPAKPRADKKGAAPAVQAAPPGDAVAGKDKAEAERCIECHGQTGQGSGHPNGAEAYVAKLAGQKTAYIVKQVQDFRSGARKHDQMAIVARNLDDADLRDIAAYFASLTPMKGEGGDVHEAGRALFEQGDTVRGIQPCVVCHGATGKGQGGLAEAPRLAGQEWRYLDQQLRDWRDGSRRNSPNGVMGLVAKPLSDREIEAVADYLAGQ